MPKLLKFTLLAVIVIFVLVIAIPFMIGFFSAFNAKEAIDLAIQKTNETGFQTVDENAYIFYYPGSYIKGQASEKEKFIYINSNTKAVEPESISLSIENVGKKLINPDYALCIKFAESMRQSSDDEIKTAVVRGGFGDKNGVGCKITMRMPVTGVNDSVMLVLKSLWNENGEDSLIYSAKALYYSNASKDEASKLDLAVDQFELK